MSIGFEGCEKRNLGCGCTSDEDVFGDFSREGGDKDGEHGDVDKGVEQFSGSGERSQV